MDIHRDRHVGWFTLPGGVLHLNKVFCSPPHIVSGGEFQKRLGLTALSRGSGKTQVPPAGGLLCLGVLKEEGGQFMVSLEETISLEETFCVVCP